MESPTPTFTRLTGIAAGGTLADAVAKPQRALLAGVVAAAADHWRRLALNFESDGRPPRAFRALSIRACSGAWWLAVERLEVGELAALVEELRPSPLVIRKLEGLLPICSWCQHVRDDDDADWLDLVTYLKRRQAVSFTDSICPACAADVRRAEGL